MKIALASDHAGFELKEELARYLRERGDEIADCGAFSNERSDYPDYARKAALAVQSGEAERAVMVCGSGIGMCMVANRFAGVRAAVLRDAYDVEMSRKHNDANVACFGGRVSDIADVRKLLDAFLTTAFEGDRHEARVKKIEGGC